MTEISNPIIPGFNPDPSCTFVDGTFYLVTSSFLFFPGIPVYTSRDLETWTQIGNVINRPEQLASEYSYGQYRPGTQASGGIWAPTIRHRDGVWYVVTTFAHPHKEWDDFSRWVNVIFTSTNPQANEWSDPIYFDFPGYDTSVFWDDDGKAYMSGSFYWRVRPGIIQFEIDLKTGKSLSGKPRDLWSGAGGVIPEAPHMIKTSGKYYLILAEGGTELGHRATMASAPTVWGPWTAVENNPILSAVSADGLFQTVGHADLFQDANSEWWIIALASRVVGESFPIGRETVMMKVDWRGDAPVVDTKAIDYPVSHLTDAPKENGTWEDVLAATGKNRHDHLLHLRIPETGTIQYQKDNTVLLVPKAGHRVSLGETLGSPSFLGVRQRHLHFECYVHFAVRYTGSQTAPEDIGAGLTVYLDHERHYSAYASRHGVSFEINQPGVAPISTLTSVTAPSSSEPVMNTFLRVIGTPDKYEFYYAPRGLATEIGNGDENAWEKLGEALTSGVSGGFTGTIIALYTVPGEGSDGAAYEVKASRWMYRSTAKEY